MPNDLAEKYRPKNLGEVVGQQRVVRQVEGMLMNEKLPPSILLHGPRSSGKTTLSRIIPTYANCQETEHLDPCWECKSCLAALKMISGERPHPDVQVINCAGDRGIDMTRNLRDRVRFRPKFNFRFFLLDECHRLTKDAQENLLTLLEEPPKGTRFILLTTNPELLKDTVRSRCQTFALSPIDTETLTKLLRKVTKSEGSLLPKKVCHEIAEAAEGYPREALKVAEQVLNSLQEGEKLDLKELLVTVRESAQYSPHAVTHAYMDGVFAANYTLAFSAIEAIDSQEFLVSRAVETIQEAMFQWVDPTQKQLHRSKPYLLKGLELPDRKHGRALLRTGQLQKLLEVYLKAQERIKSYLVNPRAVMQSATMSAIRLIMKWQKTK